MYQRIPVIQRPASRTRRVRIDCKLQREKERNEFCKNEFEWGANRLSSIDTMVDETAKNAIDHIRHASMLATHSHTLTKPERQAQIGNAKIRRKTNWWHSHDLWPKSNWNPERKIERASIAVKERRNSEREKKEKQIMSNAMTGGSIISVHMAIDEASTHRICTRSPHTQLSATACTMRW